MSTSTGGAGSRDTSPPREIAHLSVAERSARGRAARNEVPRTRQAEVAPGTERPDPIALLEGQATSRVPELVPIRYGRMLASPFAFYRGAALVMASDLAMTPASPAFACSCVGMRICRTSGSSAPQNVACCSTSTILTRPFPDPSSGTSSGLPQASRWRRARTATRSADRESIVLASARSYRTAMAQFATQTELEVFYASLDIDSAIAEFQATVSAKMLKRAQATVAKARTRDSMQAFSKLTRVVDGEPHIISDPPLIVPVSELYSPAIAAELTEWVREYLRKYRSTLDTDRRRLLERYRFVDLARKVVGVGSVGTRAWIALMFGRDTADPLFLQMKEAQPSVLEAYCGRSRYANHAHRVVAGQRLMQAASDVFLGWVHVTGIDGVERDFYLRQLRDWKGSAEIETMVPKGMEIYAKWCGWTLARAHARSGMRSPIRPISARSDTFDRAIAKFAAAYADQNERDYQALKTAAANGRITVEEGV